MKMYLRVDGFNRVCGYQEAETTPVGFDGNVFMEYSGPTDPGEMLTGGEVYVYRNGVLKNTGEPIVTSDLWMTWDSNNDCWVDSRQLENHKEDQWEFIKRQRYTVKYGSLAYKGQEYDIDAGSQTNIQTAAFTATLDSSLEFEWTTLDNQTVLLSSEDMIGLSMAVASHVEATHSHARQLRELIAVATTEAEVKSITWASLP